MILNLSKKVIRKALLEANITTKLETTTFIKWIEHYPPWLANYPNSENSNISQLIDTFKKKFLSYCSNEIEFIGNTIRAVIPESLHDLILSSINPLYAIKYLFDNDDCLYKFIRIDSEKNIGAVFIAYNNQEEPKIYVCEQLLEALSTSISNKKSIKKNSRQCI